MKKLLFTALLSLLAMPVQAQFLDVDVTHPYFHAIGNLYETGVIKGYDVNGEVLFRPRQSINRAEVLKVLMLTAGIQTDDNTGSQFPDVPIDAWFTDYVRTAASMEIVKGYPDGRFYPEAQVTRAEFLKMMTGAFDLPLSETSDDEWFSPYLRTAQDWRLLPVEITPHDSINRGEVAEILFRAQQVASDGFDGKYTYRARGKASYYNEGFAGRTTANGEIYDPYALTAAHRTLPFDTRVRVYSDAGDFVVVRINDRGPYHEDRVLDLSERAFSELAPISRGVVEVSFEVLSDPQDETPVIPEQIRPNLEESTRNPAVPDSLYDRLRKQSEAETVPVSTKPPVSQPLFDGTTVYLPTGFYEDVELRRPIPRKVAVGQVMQISGSLTDSRRPKSATVFLLNKATKEQYLFTDEVSGQNFQLPVAFYEAGLYEMGLVFDDQRRSRVGEIEVLEDTENRVFPASDALFASDLEVSVIPEEALTLWRWSSAPKRLSRLSFVQGNKTKRLIFEHGQSYFRLPNTFLDADFGANSDLVITLEQAESTDGSWTEQTTNWKTATKKSFRLWAGFPDREKAEVLSIKNFSRYYRNLDPVTLSGQVISNDIRVSETVYVTYPDGDIKAQDLDFSSTRSFKFTLNPENFGRYVIEILSPEGEILFNRAVYFSETEVLPVLPKNYTDLKIQNKSGILHWTNTIRASYRRPVLVVDQDLAAAAQTYAERMVRENFIGHIAPDGQTLSDRVGDFDFTSFGENLAYGTTLELALEGLEDSASHFKNIKNSTWKKVGIGLAQNATGDYYVVQIFAK